MLKVAILFLLVGSSTLAMAQHKYYVYFKNKQGQTLDPYEYFHSNTIERRLKAGIPLVQKSDLPVRQEYIAAVNEMADSITMVSRWFNMVCIYTQADLLPNIAQLPFVLKVERAIPMQVHLSVVSSEPSPISSLLQYQTERMEGSLFTEEGVFGKGVRIAVLDAGFRGANYHYSLEHLNIEKGYDFVKKDDYPYKGSNHGTSVLSTIGGKDFDTLMGLAPEATYLLARTERHYRELAAEEEYWLAAAEWADKHGADIINSSLGYTFKRYFREDMDGTSLVARAANRAFSKGIVVVVSAGNEGDSEWKYVGTPADADSVLSIGAIDPYTDLKNSFSSYGPNAKGILKPNLSAPGQTKVCLSNNNHAHAYGTSFSSPLVAGFVACYMQIHPEKAPFEIYQGVQECGNLHPYFDYAHGYGAPLASKAIGLFTYASSFKVVKESPYILAFVPLADTSLSKESFIRLVEGKNLYLKIETLSGKMVHYRAFNPWKGILYTDEVSWPHKHEKANWPHAHIELLFGEELLQSGQHYIVSIHFEGNTQKIEIEWP